MDLKKYCANQVEEIKRFKWIESQKAGRDLGEEAVRKWISLNAKKYRNEYEQCMEAISKKVKESIQSDDIIKEDMSEERLEMITKSIIERFTDIWVTELVNDSCDKHLEEI
jgi:hypothetical protein